MRIVQNLTRSELDAYVKQPTAKKLRDKVMKDGTYIPAGDKDAAAVYVDSRQKELAAGKAAGQDSVEISADGYALKVQEQEKEKAVSFSYTWPLTNTTLLAFSSSRITLLLLGQLRR